MYQVRFSMRTKNRSNIRIPIVFHGAQSTVHVSFQNTQDSAEFEALPEGSLVTTIKEFIFEKKIFCLFLLLLRLHENVHDVIMMKWLIQQDNYVQLTVKKSFCF